MCSSDLAGSGAAIPGDTLSLDLEQPSLRRQFLPPSLARPRLRDSESLRPLPSKWLQIRQGRSNI